MGCFGLEGPVCEYVGFSWVGECVVDCHSECVIGRGCVGVGCRVGRW